MTPEESRFMAWNKKLKEMEPVLLICFVNRYVDVLPYRSLEGGSQESWKFEDIELLRFTGQTDKHEIDIFEGDIISYSDSIEIVSFNNDNYAEIYGWNMLEICGDPVRFYYGTPIEGFSEIVGNIYENTQSE